ncbi:hypothetical protein BO71DRAFT_473675 [Aspergillus ellipticus CBS 707.79]|uniref:DUF6546 domain-containing protein n=1 Tax=Aspergillus ellipticus CBS 707.79 TaxID=1448320 RepID=A0A319EVV0_9EURO|nr:hypothetical protein BO71DRAFT_473675 [Aspergillus ellipticus CBS 707.79]
MSNMGAYRLPLELVAEVISHMWEDIRHELPTYATISLQWQTIIEDRTFKHITLSNNKRLDEFEKLTLQTPERKRSVRRIDVYVPLESCEDKLLKYFGVLEAHQRDNGVFALFMRTIFHSLCPLEDRRLLLRHRYEPKYLTLTKADAVLISNVPAITKFRVYGGHEDGQLILPATSILLASKLLQLRELDLRLWDNEKLNLSSRRANRDEFARSFELLPSTIDCLDLKYYHHSPEYHRGYMPARLMNGNIEDLLSSTLRGFSHQLKELYLSNVVVGKELLCPPSLSANPHLPSWPKLTNIPVNYAITTPSGEWYFESQSTDGDNNTQEEFPAHEEQGDLPSDVLRASCKLMNELYVSAARAALDMPRLKLMGLVADYNAVVHRFTYSVFSGTAEALWAAEDRFTPEKRVISAWNAIAMRHTDQELFWECEGGSRGKTTLPEILTWA